MDLQEWDLLSDEGLIDQENDLSPKLIPSTPTLIDMNYFQKFSDPPKKSRVIIPVPIQFDNNNINHDNYKNQDEKIEKFEEIPEEEVTKFPIESTTTTKSVSDDQQMIKDFADHQETVTTQISFRKLKDNEFVDMKMDSPKSLNRGILPQIDMSAYQFEEKAKAKTEEEVEENEVPINANEKNSMIENKKDHDNNVWKWAMTGIGALCSFGFAAATVSLIVLGKRQRESKKQAELHFQIYSNDKRFKQVMRHATKINEALTAMRGAPVTRAHITIGGYHESL